MKNYCDNLDDIPNNLCGNCFQESNLCLFCMNKIDEYKKKPFLIWDELPQNCKFRGWIFLKREKIKQKIRKKKEKIISLKLKSKLLQGIAQKRTLKDIQKYEKEIEFYTSYGAKYW